MHSVLKRGIGIAFGVLGLGFCLFLIATGWFSPAEIERERAGRGSATAEGSGSEGSDSDSPPGAPANQSGQPGRKGAPGPETLRGIGNVRLRFGDLSRILVAEIEGTSGQAPDLPEVHVFFCSMAKPYGKWLQESEQIGNPYYGASMLTCGERIKSLGEGGRDTHALSPALKHYFAIRTALASDRIEGVAEHARELAAIPNARWVAAAQALADAAWTAGKEQPVPSSEGSQGQDEGSGKQPDSESVKRAVDPKEIAFWTCSMHPSVKSKDPGLCPICNMDLTPVTQGEAESGVITLDARRRQLIGVRTSKVVKAPFVLPIRALGRVVHDERRIVDVNLKVSGWIGKIFADFEGAHVKKDEPLFTLYSPELVVAQEEYLLALKAGGKNLSLDQKELIESARTKLLLFDLRESQIAELAHSGKAMKYLPILSPANGAVMMKHVNEGSKVDAGKLLFRLVDHSMVWVIADLYESDVPLMREGLPATIRLPYLPEEPLLGEVAYVPPHMDMNTRTVPVRFNVTNPGMRLKPGMYATVALKLDLGERILVPREAVLFSGEKQVVFLDLGEGRLKPRLVKIGRGNEDHYEVLEGLEQGALVVTSANFLIAAESRLKSAVQKW